LCRGGRSGFGGRKDRRRGVLRRPGRPAPSSEMFAFWVFDMVIAVRLRWPRPVPLIATKILDPNLRSPSGGRRPSPGDPAWPNAAAGAIALAAASALDLAAELARRSNTLIAVAPNCDRNRPRKSSTCCLTKIASRPPKPPATRR
jgi:Protein of unknown function (DUF1403)